MSFKFEQLRVWQDARMLSNTIYLLTINYPKEERFGLRSQITRAADSVVLNISEGSMGQTDAEQLRFLNFARRSAIEVVAGLYLSKDRNWINETTFQENYNQYKIFIQSLSALMNYLKNSKKTANLNQKK